MELMKKLPSIQAPDRAVEAVAYYPVSASEKALNPSKELRGGRKLGQARDSEAVNSGIEPETIGAIGVSYDEVAAVLGAETASNLPELFDAPAENFTMLAQAPAAVAGSVLSDGGSMAGMLGGASATTVGAVALGVLAVGAAASSGGGSGGGSSAAKPVAAPTTVAVNAASGAIAVTIGSDATAAKLFAGTTDITAKFTAVTVGSVVTFTPAAGKVEYVGQAITAKAVDAAGTLSVDSSSVSYTFDNVAPVAPTLALGAAGVIAVTIAADASSAKIFDATGEISTKFSSAKVGSVVTFTPLAGQVEYAAGSVTAKAIDAAGNASVVSTAQAYIFDNVAPPAPSSVVGDSTNGVVSVAFGTLNGQVASSVRLFAGSTDISSKYVADTSVAGKATFTPIAGQVELTAQTLKATVADASGNVSVLGSSASAYSFDNAIDVTASNVLAAGYSAAGANYSYTVNEGTYPLSITGFGAGDLISFKGTSAPAVSIVNTSGSDGIIAITAAYGSNVVDMTLTGVAPASDAKISGVITFNGEFGAGSLTGAAAPASGGSSTVTVSLANSSTAFDAAGSNVAYTISEGSYKATIDHFSAGDSIKFSGANAAALSVVNSTSSDGSVVITGNFGSNVVDLTLTGLTAPQDGAITGVNTFNNLFGTGSLASSSTGPVSATSVSVSASNGAAGFNASGGNFAYSIAEGNYATTITGFGPGDSLSFFGSKTGALSVVNTSGSDGTLLITGSVDGQAVDITLSGLSIALDGAVFSANSFNNAFGAGSLIA